ncbi:alpha/beta hydrolase [Rhizobium sp. Rhizsp42]|uniref:alpha/beta hydrolase n=1 Tax=Rhizobium sp. Rhizsp42 TaxID=3243034 RepID=UPI0039B08639
MRRLFLSSAISALVLASGVTASAEVMTVPGPQGQLEGEAIIVPGASAGVVIVPGSGPIDRDGNSPMGLRSDSYRLLAEALASAGLSTLRIDKRGFFGSKDAIVDPEDVTIANYATDLDLWQRAFAERIGTNCVWIAGHSEGGLVALAAAARGATPCGLILLAAPGRRVSTLMREQFRNNPANAPYLAEMDRIVSGLEQGERTDVGTMSAVLQPLFRQGLQRYMIDLFSYDPAALAKGLSLPVLIVQGDRDVQVTVEDAGLLARSMPHARVVQLPGVTHMLKADVPDAPFATYQDPALPLAPGIVPAIMEVVQSQAAR